MGLLSDSDNEKYGSSYSEQSLFDKLADSAKKIGCKTVEQALCMYYAFPRVDAKYKAVIIGALGYLVCPFDAVPDILPVVGFADDVSVVAAAIGLLANARVVNEEDREKARAKLREWFSGGC